MNRVILSPGYFPDPTKGKPIALGYIYIGEVDKDPENFPIQASVQQEDGNIVQVAQPIRTNAGGAPTYNGSTVTILVDSNYSLRVRKSDLSQAYSVPSQSDLEAETNTSVTDMLGLVGVVGQLNNDTADMLGFFFSSPEPNPKGGGGFVWQDNADKATANGGTIIDPDNIGGLDGTPSTAESFITAQGTGVGLGCWVRVDTETLESSMFGLVGDDSTTESVVAQAMLDASSGKTLHWRVQKTGSYRAETLFIPSNIKIVFEPGVVMKTPTSVDGSLSRFFNIVTQDNVTIEGNGLDLTMINPSYVGEFSHCINITNGSSNIHLSDIKCNDASGDGINIGGGLCSNITIDLVLADGSRRNGLSVTFADFVHVINSRFNNSSGTNPQSGVDLEPNLGDTVTNIHIEHCEANGNVNNGFLVAMESENVLIDDCVANNNGLIGFSIDGTTTRRVQNVEIRSCKADGNTLNGFVEFADNPTFQKCTFVNSTGINVQMLENTGAQMLNNRINGGADRGLFLGSTTGALVQGNDINDNGDAGMYISTTVDSKFIGNSLIGNANSVAAPNPSNIHVFASDNGFFSGNYTREGANTDKPTTGLWFRNTASNVDNLIVSNDCLNGGTVNGIVALSADATNGGNRNGDGTYSITPN